MRLHTDDEIDNMPAELIFIASVFHHEFDQSESVEEMRKTIKFQRTRNLVLWHDHATLLNLGCIITVHVAYDPAMFFTEDEYADLGGDEAEAKQFSAFGGSCDGKKCKACKVSHFDDVCNT